MIIPTSSSGKSHTVAMFHARFIRWNWLDANVGVTVHKQMWHKKKSARNAAYWTQKAWLWWEMLLFQNGFHPLGWKGVILSQEKKQLHNVHGIYTLVSESQPLVLKLCSCMCFLFECSVRRAYAPPLPPPSFSSFQQKETSPTKRK